MHHLSSYCNFLDAWYYPKPFYKNSRGEKHAVHASADCRHLDTNNSKALHTSRSSAHSVAGYSICLAPGLARRMPCRAYLGSSKPSRGVRSPHVMHRGTHSVPRSLTLRLHTIRLHTIANMLLHSVLYVVLLCMVFLLMNMSPRRIFAYCVLLRTHVTYVFSCCIVEADAIPPTLLEVAHDFQGIRLRNNAFKTFQGEVRHLNTLSEAFSGFLTQL